MGFQGFIFGVGGIGVEFVEWFVELYIFWGLKVGINCGLLQHNYWFYMGSIQSKIKQGYSVNQKPSLKKKSQKGVKPFSNYQPKNIELKHQCGQQIPSNQQNTLSSTQSSQNSSRKSGNIDRSKLPTYPLSAFGVIQCKMDGVVKYGIGGLLESNIVLTAAHNIVRFGENVDNFSVKFVVNDGNQSKELRVDKIHVPEKWKHKVDHPKEYIETVFLNDYAILILKDHADLEKYGRLGFNFNTDHEEIHTDIILYRLNHLKIEPINFAAKIKGNIIKFNPYPNFQNNGAPILCFRDNSFTVIGVESYVFEQREDSWERCLRLNGEMYEQICEWATVKEEQIDIRDKNLGKEGIKKLIKLDWSTLATINISKNNIGPDGLKYFAKCQWKNLIHFDIGGNNIKKEGVCHLVKIAMKRLTTLNMWGNAVGSQGASMIVEGDWKYLNNINLYNNNICNLGIKKLLSANWQHLQNVNFGKNNISMDILPFFKYCVWKDIVTLNLWGNSIKNEKAVIADINKNFGKIKFLYL